MWTIRKVADSNCLVLNISGRIKAEGLLELQEAVSAEEKNAQRVEFDLENVRLVDQQAVTFLACREASGTRLRNCPLYIREWIEREKAGQEPQAKR